MRTNRDTSNTKRTHLFFHLFIGGIVLLVAIMADTLVGNTPHWGLYHTLILVAGLIIISLGFLPNLGAVSRISMNLCFSILILVLFLALLEGSLRLIKFDFTGEKRAWEKIPVYYQLPRIPTGEVYFRRAGPQTWTGQPRYTYLKQHKILPNPYENERVITINYDKKGFRNPDSLSDWDIVVTGDSFTELGIVEYEELFTTIMGEILNMKVYNLGISRCGPLTQLSLLRDYGIAKSTKHVVIIFFEGNDMREISLEYRDLVRWQNTGERSYREFDIESSFIKAFYGLVISVKDGSLFENPDPGNPNRYANGSFQSSEGIIPISLAYSPPGRSQLSEDKLHQLDYFFREYAKLGKQKEVTPWLVYMPSKRRVLDGQITFNERSTDRIMNWRPSDLPDVIAELSDQYSIKFIDLTPELIKVTKETKQLLYSPIWDAHINLPGSLITGKELARQFLEKL